MKPIHSEADIPLEFASEVEEAEFWATHYATPEFLRSVPRPTDTPLQRARQRTLGAAPRAKQA